jgi:iduronate 2-sulfatase
MRLSHFCFFVSLLTAGAFASVSAQAERLNVLFIAVDDLRPELGAYGSRAITPNIDRLAESGLRFDRAYCTQAVCGASRLSLMTSLYPEYTKERTFHTRNWRVRHPDVVTLNQLFKQNGYTTVGVGKIYNAWDGPEADFANWNRWIGTQGLKYVNLDTMEKGKEQAEALGKEFVRGPTTEIGVLEHAEELYFDGWRSGEGVRQIERLTASDEPFFLAVGFSLPHLPFAAPKKYWDLYNREDFSMPDNLGVPPGYPDYARNATPGEMRHYADVPIGHDPKGFSEAMNLRLIHGYHASVSYTDRNVGQVLDALEKSGKAHNTIIVFWSDHGWKLGEHSSWCKHTNFEIDTRVPLLIVHPQMDSVKGSTTALTELIDLYPTLAELCGLEVPTAIHGKSLVSVLKDPTRAHREYAYSSYQRRADDEIIGHSIRSDRHRYTEWWNTQTDEILGSVATDLIENPGETTNALLEDPAIGETFSRDLREIVMRARTLPSPILGR